MSNPNMYPQQQNYSQYQPTSKQFPNMNFNPNFQPQQSYGQIGVNGGVGVLVTKLKFDFYDVVFFFISRSFSASND